VRDKGAADVDDIIHLTWTLHVKLQQHAPRYG